MEASISMRSSKEYGNAGPLEIAEATADLRKSIEGGGRVAVFYCTWSRDGVASGR